MSTSLLPIVLRCFSLIQSTSLLDETLRLARGTAKVPYPTILSNRLLITPALTIDSMKSRPSPQPASAITETAHPTLSPLSPTLSVSSPATIAPHTTRTQKRKLDTEDGPAPKRLQVQPAPAPPPAVSPEPSKINRHGLGDHRDHDSHIEGDNRDNPSRIVEDNQDYETDNRYHETEDLLLTRPQPSQTPQLSKANLKQLQQELLALEEMDNTIKPSDRKRKSASSRQTSSSDLASTRSKEPTSSHSFYRHSILDRANIYVLPESPPETLQAPLDIIFKREVTAERRREISGMAKDKSRKFSRLLRGSHREDDLVELVHQALFDMHNDETLTHPRKAGEFH